MLNETAEHGVSFAVLTASEAKIWPVWSAPGIVESLMMLMISARGNQLQDAFGARYAY